MRALLEASDVTIRAPGGRSLFEHLSLRLTRERVALVGRNGVGKSTLLSVLAGVDEPYEGRVTARGTQHFVPQDLPACDPISRGEQRKRALERARASAADVLLLDEPTEDLDEESVAWLRSWLSTWPRCVLIASHDRRLLGDFRCFFVASESGSRAVSGTLSEVDMELEREHRESEARYVRNLHSLAVHEEHALHVERRKARKERYGRCSELDRGTPRMRLNQKRDHAQVSHGRAARVREARLDAVRAWTTSSRRALDVALPFQLAAPSLPAATGDVLVLREVSACQDGRLLFASIDLRLGRDRVAVVGPNGAGKTTLLDIIVGRRAPTTGAASRDLAKIGAVAQGGTDWMSDESLVARLQTETPLHSFGEVAGLLVAHKFPLALAERPLRTLSPGERTRAALLCLYRRVPAVELLVLDEPTRGLDLVGQRAMTEALRAWRGGLVVASHDRAFLDAIGIDAEIRLGAKARG